MADPISVTLATTAATTAATTLIKPLVEDVYNFVKNNYINKEDKKLYDYLQKKIHNYHINMIDKIYHLKTFLDLNTTVPFTAIYYPLSVRRYTDKSASNFGQKIKIDDKIETLFKNNRRITILGTAGSGKTMITKRIFLSALEHTSKIPFIIELRKIGSKETIFEYIKRELFSYEEYIIDDIVLIKALHSGKFLFIFDGYDEITDSNINRFDDLNNFTNSFLENYYVITSRLANNAEQLSSFYTYIICGLEKNDYFPFIDMQCKYIEDGQSLAMRIREELKDKNLTEDNISVNKLNFLDVLLNVYTFSDYFKNPLLLVLFIKTFDRYPDLPKSKSIYYERVFDTLWEEHDRLSERGKYRHEKKYDKETYEMILYYFSYISFLNKKSDFTKKNFTSYLDNTIKECHLDCKRDSVFYDLVSSISIIIEDSGMYTYPHKSLQEYFVAKYISVMTPDNKKNVYCQMQKNKSMFINNLLTLLCDIDKYSFSKYYLLPKIKELRNEMNNESIYEMCIQKNKEISDTHNSLVLRYDISFIGLLVYCLKSQPIINLLQDIINYGFSSKKKYSDRSTKQIIEQTEAEIIKYIKEKEKPISFEFYSVN